MSTPRDRRSGFDQQTARINTTDDTWRAFRQLCLDDGDHVSVVLGRLVDAEVNRRRSPRREPAVDTPAPKRVNASTREQQAGMQEATATPAKASASASATPAVTSTAAPTLFD